MVIIMEWYKKYEHATKKETIVQALEACSRHDCKHCLYQGKGIRCADRLKLDASKLFNNLKALNTVGGINHDHD